MRRAAAAIVVSIVLLVQSCSHDERSRQPSRLLSHELLMHGTDLEQPVRLAEFARAANAGEAGQRFSGRLQLATTDAALHFELVKDELALLSQVGPAARELPPFDFEFVQDAGRVLPLQSGPIRSAHPLWEWVLQPGYAWDETTDKGLTRVALPVALKERNADCLHNGLLGFLYSDAGKVSKVAVQFTNQTCKYLQFEMYGLLDATYIFGEPANAAAVIDRASRYRDSRLPQRPIEKLADDFPGSDSGRFGSAEEIDPAYMSAFGFVIDGVHYVGGCRTPKGLYPYCDEMALPSYSTAKSLVGGLGLMLAEKRYPGIRNTLVADYVEACRDGWDGVTIEHALDLVTGHYGSPEPHGDEDAAESSRFFLAEDHATKIEFACKQFPGKAAPGERWTYQTWATYLAGTALNARLRSLAGEGVDFYRDLVVPDLWKPLQLSELIGNTRRTYDAAAQPFTGFGLTLLRDDIAKLAVFLGKSDGRIDGEELLDQDLFDAIKQRAPGDPGMRAESDLIRYNNGFRTFEVSSVIGCENETWLTTMSGYGGINVVLMPNDTAYYYFSDGNVHRYLYAVRESHRIRPMCEADVR